MPTLIDLLRERLSQSDATAAARRFVDWWCSEISSLVPSRFVQPMSSGGARAEIRTMQSRV
jgi:hypothetical protein